MRWPAAAGQIGVGGLEPQSHTASGEPQPHNLKERWKIWWCCSLGLETVKEDKEVVTAPLGDQTRMDGIRNEDMMEGGAC